MQVEEELRSEFVKHMLELEANDKFKKYAFLEEFFAEIEGCV